MAKKTYRVIHIHTDSKFLYDSKNFEGEHFNNTIILIQNSKIYNIDNKEVIICNSSRIDLLKIATICNKSDLVVLYGLESYKVFVAKNIQSNVKIVWRFFGAELYNLKTNLYLSNLSQLYESKNKFKKLTELIFWMLRGIKSVIDKNYYGPFDIKKLMKKIDCVIMLMEEEYTDLKQHFENLPKFIQIPTFRHPINHDFLLISNKRNQIIVGNNMSHFNNHLEIIEIIKNSENSGRYEFIFPFSYNQSNISYSNDLLKRIDKLEYVTLLKSFMSIEKYNSIIGQSKALIQNSIRQMGVGNVMIALLSGLKIYLNPKNVLYAHLLNNGYYVASIDNLEQDLKNDTIGLTEKQIKANIEKYNENLQINNNQIFQEKIINELLIN